MKILALFLAALALSSCAANYDSAAVTAHAAGVVPVTTASGPAGMFRATAYQAGAPVGASVAETEAQKAAAFFGR